MDMPVNVPIDDPNADTEWNDILRKHGVIPEKPPSPTPIIEEALQEARKLAHENRLEGKELDELDALEDEEDEQFLEQYRQQRLQEFETLQKTSIHNQVYHLQKPDYARDVTEASKKFFVLVLLTSALGSNTESRLLAELWQQVASRYGELKFCEIRADLCIEGYPEKNCPTILIYKDREIVRQIVTLKSLRGESTGIDDLESLLVSIKAVESNDHRILRSRKQREDQNAAAKHDATASDDDDWD